MRSIGPTVFITGANRGIGLGLVKQLTEEKGIKHIFAGCYGINSTDGEESKIGIWQEILEIRDRYPSIVTIVDIDVTDDTSIREALKKVTEVLGAEDVGLDMLINNAGIMGTTGVTPQEPNRDEFLRHLNVNSIGAVITTSRKSAAAEKKRKQKQQQPACVVNISSTKGSIELCDLFYNTADGPIKNVVYGMSKCALNYYTKALAADEPSLITVAICPGWVRTNMGGPNATLSVEECASLLIDRIRCLKKSDSGTFINTEEVIKY